MINNNTIVITSEGFEVMSYNKKFLAKLGGEFFLRIKGYFNHKKIRDCISTNPQNLQNIINECVLEYYEALLTNEHLQIPGINVYVLTHFLTETDGYSLFIETDDRKYLHIIKKILCDTV